MEYIKGTGKGRGGYRGGGRKKLPDELKAKNTTFKLYDWEVEKVRLFIKTIRQNVIKDE